MTNASTSLLLVDTNILVYSLDPRNLVKQQAAMALLRTLESNARSFLSTQVLGEFFNTITRLLPPLMRSAAEQAVDDLCETFTVLPLTVEIVKAATVGSGRLQMSYWDALVWATAKLNGIRTILTEDMQSSAVVEGIAYINPFQPDFDLASL